MPAQEKQIVIRAVNDLGRRVTVADVSEKTGLSLSIISSELNRVAAEAGGHLEVGTGGDIAYQFDFGFQNAYLAKGIQRYLQIALKKLFDIGYFLLRISFGIMLILSLLTIIVLILVIVFASSRMNDRDGESSFNFDFFDWIILRDIFFWGAYSSYPSYPGYNVGYQHYDKPATAVSNRSDGNFLYNCFSFLFGDGNPNAHLEERRWQMVAQIIRENKGVVVAEQLAPYVDFDPKNEDAVLPVLVRFNGRPEVSESGNIVYAFPELQVSAAESQSGQVPTAMKEWTWEFSKASTEDLIPVIGLAGLNFLGSWWLFSQSTRIVVLFMCLPLLKVLVVYGTLFVAVPAVRFLVLKYLNARIEKRNDRRTGYALQVSNADDKLRSKLNDARQFAIAGTKLDTKNIVYTTDKDLLEQQFKAPDSESQRLLP